MALTHCSPSRWPAMDSAVVGVDYSPSDPELSVGDLLGVFGHLAKGEAFLAWHRLDVLGELHSRLVETVADDRRAQDALVQVAARVGMTRGQSVNAILAQLDMAVAMRDRLPATGRCLRDGLISGPQFRGVVSWTDLVDGQPYALDLDAEIAAVIRAGRGIAFSLSQLRHRVDRLVFRRDPDAVRQRRTAAIGDRRMFTEPGSDGMATIGATMTAEDVQIAAAHVKALAKSVCSHDPRPLATRASDAMYALLTCTPFDCQCPDRDSCTAPTAYAEPGGLSVRVDPKVVIHVVINHSTLASEDDEPGFLDGHGVISAAHARDMAARADAVVRPVNPDPAPRPAAQPGDPYRPTTLLDTFLRIRDGHSVVPGSHAPAWACDLDHVDEYSFTDPASGGQTCPNGMNTKDRLFHNLKTHGAWLDDHDVDAQGRAHPVFYTPEGDEIRGHPGLGIDLFPGLATVRFAESDPTATACRPEPTDTHPCAARTRLQSKHQRRRAERARNRQDRLARDNNEGDPPF